MFLHFYKLFSFDRKRASDNKIKLTIENEE